MLNREHAVGFITLRALVGFLGEQSQLGWWDTDFLGKTGRTYLQFNFPRSHIAAAVNAVTEAARRVHDERIGRIGAFHLFRLPYTLEESLFEALRSGRPEGLEPHLGSKDAALLALANLANTTVDAPEGPVQVGSLDTLETPLAVEELAKHYHDAFSKGRQCFPYFASVARSAVRKG